VAPDRLTAPFTLGPAPPGAAGSVLLLHGFTGSPWEVRPLGESLAARGFHVEAPLLPGHGGEPEALRDVSWQDWLRAAEAAHLGLERAASGPVAVVGLSMGALLALLLAARRPQGVAGLVLLAPVVRLRRLGARLLRALRATPLRRAFPAWVSKHTTDLSLDEERLRAPLLARYPLARALDLFALQDLAEAAVPQVACPVLALAAAHDHVVALAGVEALVRRLPHGRLVVLQRGWHIIPRDADRALASACTADFLEELELGRAAA
jgi:carboxylesterase